MEFYITIAGEVRGPITEAELRAQLARGELAPDTPGRRVGGDAWFPLQTLFPPTQPPPLPRMRSPLSASFSWGAAAVAILLVAVGWLVSRNSEASAAGSPRSWIGFTLLVFGAVAAFVGLLCGIAGISQRGRPKRAGGFGLAVNALVLAGASIFLQGSIRDLRLIFAGRLAGTADPAIVAGRAIPLSPTVRTHSDFLPTLRGWYERNWLESYLTIGRRSPKWDEAGTNLIRAWIRDRVDPSLVSSDEPYSVLSGKVLAAGCDDALLLALCAYGQPTVTESLALAERAHTAFIGTPDGVRYPAVVKLRAKVNFARYLGRNASRRGAVAGVEESAIPVLKQALEDGSFRREESRVFSEWLLDSVFEAFFDRNSEAVSAAMEQAQNLEPWLAPYVRARHHITAAWKARGSGYANSVTSEGWQEFSHNLNAARACLAKAWKLDPKQPAIAVAMMRVQLGTGDAASMRDWFDKAVRAELDYAPAYTSLRWGLRPRWHGSHEALLAFGEACLATKRFDTDVPFHYLNALRDVVAELGDEGEALYANPAVYRNLRAMYDGYLAARPDPMIHDRMLSDRAIAAFLAGKLDECRRDLETLQYRLLPEAVRLWPRDYSDIPTRVAALTSPAKAFVERGEAERLEFHPGAALAEFQRAASLVGNDTQAAQFVRRRISELELEDALGRGQSVDFLPDAGMQSWRAINCAARRLDDGAWEIEAEAGGYQLFSLSRVGPDFEITGEVEFVSSESGAFQGGVVVGAPGNDWWSFRFAKRAAPGLGKVYVARKWTTPDQHISMDLKERNAFNVRSQGGKVTVVLNGLPILTAVPWPIEEFAEPRNVGVGLGAYSNGDKTVVRYRNVKLRRLE